MFTKEMGYIDLCNSEAVYVQENAGVNPPSINPAEVSNVNATPVTEQVWHTKRKQAAKAELKITTPPGVPDAARSSHIKADA